MDGDEAVPEVPVEKPKKKRGRPRKIDTCVEEVPARCPKCGSTDRTRKENVRTRAIRGTTRDGRDYNLCIWSQVTCNACNQSYRVITRKQE